MYKAKHTSSANWNCPTPYQGGVDFWPLHRDDYNLLSALTSPEDWQFLLSLIAGEMARCDLGSGVEVLDVGAGTGINSKAIQDRLSFTYEVASRWVLTEPNANSRAIQTRVFSASSPSLRLAHSIPDLSNSSQEHFNSIIFLHSTYYTSNMLERIVRYRAANLHERGAIVIVAMATESPFFLGCNSLVPPNTADTIIEFLRREKIVHTVSPVVMRMRLPTWLTTKDMLSLHKLMTGGRLSRREFDNRLCRFFLQEADLRDRLIVIPA